MIPSVKAGPNNSIAALGATFDALAFKADENLTRALEEVANVTAPKLYELFNQEIDNLGE